LKNKVVVFTENNARILINPPNLEAFDNKPKSIINPDMSLVCGVDPQFWKLIDYDFIELPDAIVIKDKLSELIDWTNETPSHQERFYREAYHSLEDLIRVSGQAAGIIAKLLPKAQGIDKKELVDILTKTLIEPSKSDHKIKENKLYKDMIDTWSKAIIAPMDEEEKAIRSKHIAKHGAINQPLQMKQKYGHIYLGIISLILAILTILWVIKKH